MPQIINTNLASINAQRNLDASQKDNATALQRLSSGLRINSARDDAAGLAISTRFTTQVEGINVGIRNAGDGVSLAQTAEGALGAMTSALQRMRELALQSANATNSDIDRTALNQEVQQLKNEVDRVAKQTNFNGTKLLDGSFSDVTFQIGANSGESISFSVNEASLETLGIGSDAGISSFSTSDKLTKGDLVINGISIDSSRSADDTASIDNQAGSAIAKAAAINYKTEETGVVATVNTNTVAGSSMVNAAAAGGQISINNVIIDVTTGGLDPASDRAAVVAAINANSIQTGVLAIDSRDDATGVILEASDGRNITISGDTDIPNLAGTAAFTSTGVGIDFSTTGLNANLAVQLDGVATTTNLNIASANDFDGTAGNTVADMITAMQTALNISLAAASAAGYAANDILVELDANGNVSFRDTTGHVSSMQLNNNGGSALAITGLGFTLGQNTASVGDGLNAGSLSSLGLTAKGTYEGTVTLTSANGEDIKIAQGSGDVEKSGFIAGTYAARTALMNSNIQQAGSTFEWNGSQLDFSVSTVAFDLDLGTETASVLLNSTLPAGSTIATIVGEINTDITASNLNGKVEAYAVEGKTNVFSFRTLGNEPDTAITMSATNANGATFFGLPQNGTSASISATKPALSAGDLVINGVQIPAAKGSDDTASDNTYNSSVKAASGIAMAAAVNKATDDTGVSATVNPTTVNGTQGTAGVATETGQLYINGIDIGVLTASDNQELDKATAISQINLFTGQTGVSAEDNGTGITLTASDGRNISIAWNTDADDDGVELAAGHFGIGGAGEIDFDTADDGLTTTVNEYSPAGIAQTTYSTVRLRSAGPIQIESGSGGSQALYNLGFDAGAFGGSEGGQLIKDLDITTVTGALSAIDGLDNALDQINLQRASLGAIQNRFENTIDNQAITSENLQTANSRIRDADFAAETAELSRTQVLQSAGLSILAQANAQPESVLQLLQ